MERIPESEFLHFAPEEEGSVRVNHDSVGCSGSSKSLKVTRAEDGRVFAKCYRCGGFGSFAGSFKGLGSYAKKLSKKKEVVPRSVSLPSDYNTDLLSLPVLPKTWLIKQGIIANDLKQFNIGYSEKWERLVFPIYHGSELSGFQARYFGKDKELPKYITRYKNDADLWTYIPNEESDKVVIVEDLISGVRCSRFANACVLMGTNFGDKCFNHVMNLPLNNMIVFLDDDNRNVQKKAIDIKDKLTMVGKRARIHHSNGIDPKEFTDDDLSNIIEGY